MHGGDRIGQDQAPAPRDVVLDHGQHQGGGAHLQEGGHFGQVGVADDDVQPAVAVRVGMGLVPGVDDGALQRGLQANLLLEELRPLGQLEVDPLPSWVAVSDPTFPAPAKIWRVTKCGVMPVTMRVNGVARSIR